MQECTEIEMGLRTICYARVCTFIAQSDWLVRVGDAVTLFGANMQLMRTAGANKQNTLYQQ